MFPITEKLKIDDLFTKPNFKFGKLSGRDVGSVQSQQPGVTCWPSGRLLFNVGSTKALQRVAKAADLTIEECSVILGVDEMKMLVAVYPVPIGTTDAEPLRLTKATELATIHLKAIFAEFPSFRSSQTLFCPVFEHTDAEGKSCLVVSIQSAVPKFKRSRRPKAADAAKDETKGEAKGTTKDAATKDAPATDPAAAIAKAADDVAPGTSTTGK